MVNAPLSFIFIACSNSFPTHSIPHPRQIVFQKKYIIERTKDALNYKIKEIYNNKNILKELSEENLIQINEWTWKKKALLYKKFFDENLEYIMKGLKK